MSQVQIAKVTPSNKLMAIFSDTSFVTGDSPATHNFLTSSIGCHATDVTVINDGAGDINVSYSTDGTNYSSNHLLKFTDGPMKIQNVSIHSIRMTWVSNSSYRIIGLAGDV